MKTNNGGPAFPQYKHEHESLLLVNSHPGMSLRAYLAGQALAGWLASFGDEAPIPKQDYINEVAEFSCDCADALIKRLEEDEVKP